MIKNQKSKTKKTVLIEFSHNFIIYNIQDDNNIQTIKTTCKINDDFKTLLNIWFSIVDELLKTFNFEFKLILLIKSEEFSINHCPKDLSLQNAFEYFANKLSCDKSELEISQIKNGSFLLVKTKFLKDILLKFKDYEINAIYDISSLNSFSIKENNNIYVDISLNNFDIILNHNILQKRSFSYNLSDVIKSCATTLYTDNETSLQNLKNSFRDIKTYKQLENSTKPVENEIKKFIDNIANKISSSLSYFSIYDNVKIIEKIFINGDILEYDFLIHLLSDKLNVKFIPITTYVNLNSTLKTNITLFKSQDENILNLNKLSLDGINYNDGKNEYIFIENRFISKKNLNKNQENKLNSIQKIRVENKKNLEYNDKFNKSIFKMSMGELSEFIIYKIKYIKSNDFDTSLESRPDSSFYMKILAILAIVIGVYFLITFISNKENKFNIQVYSLEDRVKRVDKLKQELNIKNQHYLIQNSELNKIFWTQKIVTIANLMPNEIWLSSINLENVTKKIEDKEVTSKVLILEARALPSAKGHIASISTYMQDLLNANDEFKKDFVSINFGGAEIINEYGYDVINFKLLCTFEKNINIKNIEKKEKENSVSTNISNINKYKKEQIDILNTIGK